MVSYSADKPVIDTHTDGLTHTHGHTDAGNDNTPRPKRALGKNETKEIQKSRLRVLFPDPAYNLKCSKDLSILRRRWLKLYCNEILVLLVHIDRTQFLMQISQATDYLGFTRFHQLQATGGTDRKPQLTGVASAWSELELTHMVPADTDIIP